MEYFDSDVIFNFLIIQDDKKHSQSRQLVFESIKNSRFVISTLVIQEVGYGLSRFDISNDEIDVKLSFLASQNIISVDQPQIIRAIALAKEIGFKHINDCVHTAIAESVGPDKFYTFNRSDFKRIQRHTTLPISIL